MSTILEKFCHETGHLLTVLYSNRRICGLRPILGQKNKAPPSDVSERGAVRVNAVNLRPDLFKLPKEELNEEGHVDRDSGGSYRLKQLNSIFYNVPPKFLLAGHIRGLFSLPLSWPKPAAFADS